MVLEDRPVDEKCDGVSRRERKGNTDRTHGYSVAAVAHELKVI